ncbi:MAG TPA: M4 family metallopeptidase [Kofleriaceae bacterium]
MKAILAACAVCTACAPTSAEPVATEPIRYLETAPRGVDGLLEAAALDYARSVEDALDLAPAGEDDYRVTSVVAADGLRHVRLAQLHAGVPVVGGELVVHADDSVFLGLNGAVVRHLDDVPVAPTLSAEDATAAARADLGVDRPSEETAELVIQPGDGAARLLWRVAVWTPAPWHLLVDAESGAVVDRRSGILTIEQASGPGGNVKKVFDWMAELDVEPDGSLFAMETGRLRTVNRQDGDQVIEGAFDAMPDQAANDAHGYAEVTLGMLSDWMSRDSLDGHGLQIKSRVHDEDYCDGAPANACWDGRQITYGDGGDRFYPLSGALDVVAHELAHGFTSYHSNVHGRGQPGALNEHFSDVAGTAAEFYREGDAADFQIGEDVTRGDDPLRFMCDPTADGWSVGHMSDYRDDMDPHRANGIPNRAFCLAVGRYRALADTSSTVAAVLGVGHIWFSANAAYWISDTNFKGACQGTLDAARALGNTEEVVEALAGSWADVGVDCRDAAAVCDTDGDCDWGSGETCATCAEDCGACSEECSAWKWAKCAAGLDDCSRCDRPAGCGDRQCTGDETDATCAADCGCSALGCEDVAPFGCWCDAECEARGDCCADHGEVCPR